MTSSAETVVPYSTQPLVRPAAGPITDICVQGSYVYWADSSGMKIGRCNIDGTGCTTSFCSPGATALWSVCADSKYLYWTDNAVKTIGRANLDGSSPNNRFITGLASGSGYYVRVTAANVFWSVYSSPNGTIGAAALDGTVVNATLISGCNSPHQIVVDSAGRNIYWSEDYGYATFQMQNGGTIGHASLSGFGANITASNIVHRFVGTAASDGPTGVVLDSTYVYWVDFGWPGLFGLPYHPRIGRALLNGTQVDDNYAILDQGLRVGVWPLALANGVLYWSPNESNAGIFSLDVATNPGRPLATHADVGRAAQAAIAPYIPSGIGSYFRPPIIPQFGGGAAGTAPTPDALYLVPVVIPWPTRISGVSLRASAAAGNVLAGLYDAAGTQLGAGPSTANSTWVRYAYTHPVTVGPGLYWQAVMYSEGTKTRFLYDWLDAPAHGTSNAQVQGTFALPATVVPPGPALGTSGEFVPAVMTF